MPRTAFSGHLDLLMLSTLRGRALHGYGVIEYVRDSSGGRFDYPEGTVYPALHRLEDEGLLRGCWSELEGRRRRVYELTRVGEKALAGHRSNWQDFVRSVNAVIELQPPGRSRRGT
jgi:PadR family transcriptional regulator, regulatory protein PadR